MRHATEVPEAHGSCPRACPARSWPKAETGRHRAPAPGRMGSAQHNRVSRNKRRKRSAAGAAEAGEGQLESWMARAGKAQAGPALERECPGHTRSPIQVPGAAAPGQPLPPASPWAPAPCCRTRRWQARWCSCPRTSPPPNCRPAADPTSAGGSWPLRRIGAAAPAAERKPGRLLTPTAAAAAAAAVLCTTAAAGCGAPGRPPRAPLRLWDSPRSQAPPRPAPATPPAAARRPRPLRAARGRG